MKFFFTIEKFLVRHFGVSLISWIVCRQAGVKRVTTFMLTTVGRKSGRAIDTPIFYFKDGDAFYVIASKGGAPRHPLWFLNLQENPQAWIQVHGSPRRAVIARVAKGAERARLWAHAATLYPPYDGYQTKATTREIPVVVLDPRGA